MLAAGRSVTDAAKEVGVARQTLSKWQSQPMFRWELESVTEDLVRQSRRDLRALAAEATATVRELLRSSRSDAARLQAARLVLDSVGVLATAKEAAHTCLGPEVDLDRAVALISQGVGGRDHYADREG